MATISLKIISIKYTYFYSMIKILVFPQQNMKKSILVLNTAAEIRIGEPTG
jgi:hypothetical protein